MLRKDDNRANAIIIGISLVFMAAIAGIGYGYAFDTSYKELNTASLSLSIAGVRRLTHLAAFSFLLIWILDLVVSWKLYLLYRFDHRALSLLTSFFRLLYTLVLGFAIYYLFMAAFVSASQVINKPVIIKYLDSFLFVWMVGLVVFGAHLFTLGWLLKKTKAAPKWIYWLLIFAGCCYSSTSLADLLLPNYLLYKDCVNAVLSLPMALSELAFAFWLLFARKKKAIS